MNRSLILVALLILVLASCADTEAPPPALSYVSLGDSLAVGVGSSDPEERGYAPLLRGELAESSGRKVRLTQLGVSGETSESFIGQYPDGEPSQLVRAERTLSENPGAVVTISIGGNDLLRAATGTDADRAASLERYGRNLDLILKTLDRASDPAPRVSVLALYNPAPGSFTDEWTGKLNEEIRRVARRNGVSVAPGDQAFRGHEREYTRHARDPFDPHPTDAGYRALADAFARAIEVPERAAR